MGVQEVAAYIERAYHNRVPHSAVRADCRRRSYSPARADEAADDAANESYKRALVCELRQDGYFHSEAYFRLWVKRTAINVLNDDGRRARKESGSALLDLILSKNDRGDDFVEVRGCLDALGKEEQLTLALSAEGATLVEIADALDERFPGSILKPDEKAGQNPLPSPTARGLRARRIRERAIEKLAACLESHGINPYRPSP
jgi:hypothetical protein